MKPDYEAKLAEWKRQLVALQKMNEALRRDMEVTWKNYRKVTPPPTRKKSPPPKEDDGDADRATA